ncbi:MAG TPA: hypothetical protein VFM62_01965 [Arthrobacter sp.]|nr:hypothetical protein [Arthrobacter sp.]
MGSFNASALTGWASPDAVDAAANDIKNAGKAVQDTTADAKSTWSGLNGVYEAPEKDIVLSAFDDVATAGDEVQNAAVAVSDALTTFASEVRALLPARNALTEEAATANAEPEDPDDEVTDSTDLQERINSMALQYKEAEDRCATSIMGVHSTFMGGPGFAGTPLVGASSSLTQGLLGRTDHSPIQRPTFGGQPQLNAPLRVDQQPYDVEHRGTRYTLRPSGILIESSLNTTLSHPQPVDTRYSHTTFSADPSDARPPAWAKWGGRGLGVAGAGITLWDATSSRWRQDLVEHPEWDTGARVASAGIDAVAVGGTSLALAAAGAKAGAVVGTMIGGPVGLAVGVVVGAGAGFVMGTVGKEIGEWAREKWDDELDAVAEGVADAGGAIADKAGEVWDSLWG